jgi:hypothetical protein
VKKPTRATGNARRELKPAPSELALRDPLLRHLEPEVVDVVANGHLDVRDAEERHDLLDVRLGLSAGVHRVVLTAGTCAANDTEVGGGRKRVRCNNPPAWHGACFKDRVKENT